MRSCLGQSRGRSPGPAHAGEVWLWHLPPPRVCVCSWGRVYGLFPSPSGSAGLEQGPAVALGTAGTKVLLGRFKIHMKN